MSLKASSCTCVTILLLLPGLLGFKNWKVTYQNQEICAPKGSSVIISCTYQYPSGHTVKEAFWINKREGHKEPADLKQDPQYRDRLTYIGDMKKNCTVRIDNVRESDSTTYWFRFITDSKGGNWIGEPGVTLSVTDLQVKKHQQSPRSRVTLTCENTCHPNFINTYIWRRDGKYVPNEYDGVLETEEDGRYSCALRKFEDVWSGTVYVSVEYAPRDTSVSISPSGDIVEGNTVTLTCNSNAKPSVYTYSWFKNEVKISEGASRQDYGITNITSEDSGQYYCVARNTHGTDISQVYSVNVLYSPKDTSVSISHPGDIVEGSSVTLTCNSKANPPVDTYAWFKNGAQISQGGSWQDYNITNITSEDSGQYYCVTKNTRGTGTSQAYSVNVLYSPKDTTVSFSPFGEIVEGSSVTLICNSKANPAADKYTWFKNGAQISQGGSWQDYGITNITSEDSGKYSCIAENTYGTGTSQVYTVNVLYAPRDTSLSISPSGDIVEGSSVTLTCTSKANPPADTYTWFKNGAAISQKGQDYYTFTNIRSEDSGEYYCEANNKVGTHTSNKVIFSICGKQAAVIGSAGGISAVVVLVGLIVFVLVWKSRGKCSKAIKETGSTQHGEGIYSDPLNDTYTSLDMRTVDSVYDTLETGSGTTSEANPEK